DGVAHVKPGATVLALGGGSWSHLGSDATWVPWLERRGVEVSPLKPANCGFETRWSEHFRARFAGAPVKPVTAWREDGAPVQGEFVITEQGAEASLVSALSAPLRDEREQRGHATLHLDLAPNRDLPRLIQALRKPRRGQSMANHLRKQAGLEGVKAGLLREGLGKDLPDDPVKPAEPNKDPPLRI